MPTYEEVITKGDGRSWEHAKKAGFTFKVWINIDFDYRSDDGIEAPPDKAIRSITSWNYLQGRPNTNVGTIHRKVTREHLCKQLMELLGVRKKEWRTISHRDGDKYLQVFTKDLDWIIMAKLAGHLTLIESITRVETLDSNEAIS